MTGLDHSQSLLSNLIDSNLPPSNAQLQIARAILSQNELDIEKLEGEIAELRERADRLAQEHQAAADSASKMQSIVSPWRRLPPELLSHTFVLCADDDPDYFPAVDLVPLLLLQVCHAWRSIALATPALWARMNYQIWKPEDIAIADTWLSRSGAYPLDLQIVASYTHTDPAEVEQLFKKYHHNLRSIQIDAPVTLIPRLLDGAPLLHTLDLRHWHWPKISDLESGPSFTMRSLPSLRRFSCNLRYLYNFNIPWHQLTHLYMSDGFDSEGTIHSNLHILSRCPALILCSLGLSSDEDSHPSSYKNPMILSYLESFSIAVRSCRVETADRLFSSLTLPALRALDLQGSGRPSPHVINSFFGRSACPLDTLHLLGSNMPSADLMQWLRPVTKTMDSLTLIVGVHPADDLLRALTRNEEETCLCPNLRSIMFSSSESSWSWTSGLMADMVESRWRDGANSRLQSAYISRYDERRVMNDVDDVPRLQQLKDRGLDITCSGNWGELLTD